MAAKAAGAGGPGHQGLIVLRADSAFYNHDVIAAARRANPKLARACQNDHITPWPAGPTHLDNITNECVHDHQSKTEKYFTVTRTNVGKSGHIFTSQPRPPSAAGNPQVAVDFDACLGISDNALSLPGVQVAGRVSTARSRRRARRGCRGSGAC